MRIVTSLLLALAAVLVWLSFVGMASPAHAQGPTPAPTGPSAMLPLAPPARITVHPRPRLHQRHCVRWYVVPYRPLFRPDVAGYMRVRDLLRGPAKHAVTCRAAPS
jgi:hypothetical protein